MLNYKVLFFSILGVIALIVGAYFYGAHNQYIKDSLKNEQQIVLLQSQSIQKISLLKQSGDNIIIDLANKNKIYQQQFETVIGNLRNEKNILTRKLNDTNHINGILVRSVQLGVEGIPVSTNTVTPGGAYDTSSSYKASDVVSAIIDLSKQANVIRNNYMALQNYNRQIVEIYNK